MLEGITFFRAVWKFDGRGLFLIFLYVLFDAFLGGGALRGLIVVGERVYVRPSIGKHGAYSQQFPVYLGEFRVDLVNLRLGLLAELVVIVS